MAEEGAACSRACGYCGMCTPAWAQPPNDPEPRFCDHCGNDVFMAYTEAGHTYCSRGCALAADEARKQTDAGSF